MKDYIIILLTVLSTSILLGNPTPVKTNFTTEVADNVISASEATFLSEMDEISEIEISEITTKATTSTPVTTSTTSSKVKNYTITKIDTEIEQNPTNYIHRLNKLVYAHNSNDLLGSIKDLEVGETFTLTENGTVKTYKVAEVKIFAKSGSKTLSLCTSGYENCEGTYYMSTLINARINGKTYDAALFTCDGTSLGNGDATHRRVVFAIEA